MSVLVSPIGRIAYPHLFKAHAYEDGDKPKFSVILVYDPSINLKAVKAACKKVAAEKYPNGVPPRFRWPFRKGSEKVDDDGNQREGFEADDVFLTFSRNADFGPFDILDQHKNDAAPEDIYAGCLGRVVYNPYTYDYKGNKGVALGLEAFQKTKDGDRIGRGRVNGESAFDDIEDDDEFEDSELFDEADEEVPF